MATQRRIGGAVMGLTCSVWLLLAQGVAAQDRPMHMRGTLAGVAGPALTIRTREGTTETVTLGEKSRVFVVGPAKLSDVTPGQFVGITSVESAGKRMAVEVHIFAETLRGLAEGHYDWDLLTSPNMMTNATVATVAAVGEKNRELSLTYREGPEGNKTEGTQTIIVPLEATIVDFNPATPDVLVAGGQVFLLVVRGDDGKLTSPAIVVGKAGTKPPM
jgi:hypothetical protein